jgi:ATP-dependent RNA helicase DeaD
MFSPESPLPATSSDVESQPLTIPLPVNAPEAEITHSSTNFDQLKLIVPLMQAVKLAGYKSCTPVQAAVIPPAMLGKDVIGQAQTGTGKTCAFLLPFMNRWRPHKTKGSIGLVMAPTRELALQVSREAEKLSPSSHFRTVAVYGGTGMQKQLDALSKGCDLVVGTPGRMLDHLSRGTLNLSNVRYIVLDEADRMLDIGFRPDIERILRRCPEKRQTLLMSATVPDEIKKLTHKYMTDPLHLNLSPKVLTVDKIRQTYITVEKERKFDLLVKWLEREQPKQAIIFVERKRSADNLHRKLRPYVAGAAAIHGDLPQTQREKIMAGFRTGKVTCLIATDVASRGIDVSGISHVINYDLPMDIENYVHRIGRTGRIGKEGVAVSFVLPEEGGHLTDIEMTINKLIEADTVDGFEAAAPRVRRNVGDPEPERNAAEAPVAPKQAIFGKRVKKYSERL